jgi:hypothetical protein
MANVEIIRISKFETTQPGDMLLGLTETSEELLAHKSRVLLEISKMSFGSGEFR